MTSWFGKVGLEPERVRRLPLTLAVGLAGGLAALAIGLPAPWLSGPAMATAAGAIAGFKLGMPTLVRTAATIALGVMMGSAVRPETFAAMGRWPLTLAGLVVVVPAIMAGVATYLQRVHGFDAATARLAAVPGALPFVLATAAQTSADAPRVLIVQLFRLTVIAAALPTLLALVDGGGGAGVDRGAAGEVLVWQVAAAMAAGVAGCWLFTWTKLAAPALFGSMMAAALVYGSGWLTTAFPAPMVVANYLVVGAMTGASFATADRGLLVKTLPAAAGALAVGTAIGLAFALPIGWLSGLPPAQVWLAYAPGGVETMAIIALALGFDTAFVGAHHVARFLGLGVIVPIWLASYRPGRNIVHDVNEHPKRRG